jgi:hypothetical protein
MKLSKLFMIALLAGTLALIGCGDDTTTSDNGGNGNGNGTSGNCDYGTCVDNPAVMGACETAVGLCMTTLPDGSDAQNTCIAAANADACGDR